MANTAHFVRRQSSRDLHNQRSIDRLELKEMKGRLVPIENGTSSAYGATNIAFEDTSPGTKIKSTCSSKRGSQVNTAWNLRAHFWGIVKYFNKKAAACLSGLAICASSHFSCKLSHLFYVCVL